MATEDGSADGSEQLYDVVYQENGAGMLVRRADGQGGKECCSTRSPYYTESRGLLWSEPIAESEFDDAHMGGQRLDVIGAAVDSFSFFSF